MALVDVYGDGSLLAGLRIRWKALRQGVKSPVSIGSRTIANAELVSGDKIRCELANGPHAFTIDFTAGPGNSYEKVFTWMAGGIPPIYAPDTKIVDGYQDTDNSIGALAGGAQPGDGVVVSLAGFTDWIFLLTLVEPFAGSEEPTWGGQNVFQVTLLVGGTFKPNPANLAGGGKMTAPATGDWVKEGSTVYSRIETATRPSTIPTHTFWHDEDGEQLVLSTSNEGANLTIRYGVTGVVGDFTESHTVATSPVNLTDMDYSDYSTADETSVTYMDGGATVPTHTDTNSSGSLAMQLPGTDAGKLIRIRAAKNVPGEAPSNGVLLFFYPGSDLDDEDHGYLSFGRKRDVVEFYRDGFPIERIPDLVGQTLDFQWSAVRLAPVSNAQYVEENGSLVNIGTRGTDWEANGGGGWLWVAAAWLAAHPGISEFLLPGAKYVDARGILPAAVMNKMLGISAALNWVFSDWGVGLGDLFLSQRWSEFYDWIYEEGTGCTSGYDNYANQYEDPLLPILVDYNLLDWEWTYNDLSNAPPVGRCAVCIQSAPPFGVPGVIMRLPDGCEILEAKAEVTISDCSHHHVIIWQSTDTAFPGTIEETFDTTDVTVYLMEYYRDGSQSVISSGFAPGGANKQEVVDCTDLMRHIYATRHNPNIIGYGPVCCAGGVTPTGGGQAFLDGVLGTVPDYIYPASGGVPQSCMAFMEKREGDELHWGDISLGALWLRIQWPALGPRDTITERWAPGVG